MTLKGPTLYAKIFSHLAECKKLSGVYKEKDIPNDQASEWSELLTHKVLGAVPRLGARIEIMSVY